MAGISNHGQNGGQPYVTAGDRAYLIGTQDGNFPDLGDHVPGEMGGLWLHPIKLIDGFWAQVTRSSHPSAGRPLEEHSTSSPTPTARGSGTARCWTSLDIERFQFSPDGQPGVIVQYEFKNAARSQEALDLSILREDGTDARSGFRITSG